MAYSNHGSSLARRVFRSGLFAEGWAVYVTQVMLDAGYGDNDPALWLNHWKYYLRCVTNTIIDVRIHTLGMTTDEAIALMVDGAFQERAEAVQKDERARLSARPSCRRTSSGRWGCGTSRTPLDGGRRWPRARRPMRCQPRAWSAATRTTPGFDHRAHLEAVISHGAPPISILRRILLGDG